jgi:aspartyl/asparaginyl beta-hydroxylase (cupin superfamily)
MITHLDLIELYNWAKDTEFPVKTAPTIEGYSNQSIDYYWIKSVKKSTLIREKLMTDKVRKIYDNDDILFSNYAIFYAGTILKPHKDPNILRYPYKRIQIPLTIPNKNECYMQWVDVKDGKVLWEEGVPQVCDVMNHLHEAFNKSDKPMEILFVDVKHDTEVVINR